MKKNKTPFYKRGDFWGAVSLITALVVLAIFLNMRLANNTEKIRMKSEGQLRLTNIASSVENNLAQAESYAESYAAQLEMMLQENGELEDEEILGFVRSQNKTLQKKTDGLCFSTYVAYKDALYIEDFIPDTSFHLSERVWYVGAKKIAVKFISRTHI